MDNPQNPAGQSNPTNADRTTPNTNSTDTSTGAARKSGTAPSAQSPGTTPNVGGQPTANAGADRQGEGQQTNGQEGTLLDTALESGKKWIEDSGALDSVNQLPQAVKDLGNRAVARFNSLTTTQKVVGGTIIAAGIGWLATRKGKSSDDDDSSSYNYGRQRDAGYGRRNAGYQAPSRPERGGDYGTSGNRYNSGSGFGTSRDTNYGTKAGSGRSDSGYGSASASTDHGAQAYGSAGFGTSTDE